MRLSPKPGENNEFPNMLHTEIQIVYSHQFQNKILETILILLPSRECIILVLTALDIQYLNWENTGLTYLIFYRQHYSLSTQ